MNARHITIDQERKRLLVGLAVDEQFQAGNARQNTLAARFKDELILGRKMTIEASASESRSSHHSLERRITDSIGGEFCACRFNNSLARLSGLDS
jgi:hypothetical protein